MVIVFGLTGCLDFFPGLIPLSFQLILQMTIDFFENFKNEDLRLGKLDRSDDQLRKVTIIIVFRNPIYISYTH